MAFSCTFLSVIKMKVPYTPHFLSWCFCSTSSVSVPICPIIYCWANPSTAHTVNLKYNRSFTKPSPFLSAALKDVWAKRSDVNVHTKQISGHNSDSFQPLNMTYWTTTQRNYLTGKVCCPKTWGLTTDYTFQVSNPWVVNILCIY